MGKGHVEAPGANRQSYKVGTIKDAEPDSAESAGYHTLLQKDGKAIAFSITKEDLLHLIMVDVPFQNTGYGKMLLSHVETELFNSYNCIRLQSFMENIAAARFYVKHGWQAVKQTDMPEMGVTLVQYEKEKP